MSRLVLKLSGMATLFVGLGVVSLFRADHPTRSHEIAYAAQPDELAKQTDPSQEFATQVQPLLKQFCFECHGSETQESGIRVDQLVGTVSDEQLGLWKAVKRVLNDRKMPPEDADVLQV